MGVFAFMRNLKLQKCITCKKKNEIKYHGTVLVIFHRRNKSLVRVCFFGGSHKYMKSQQFSQSLIYESLFETYLKPIPSLQSQVKYSKLRFQTTVNFQSKNTQHNFHLYVRMLDICTLTLHNCLTSAKNEISRYKLHRNTSQTLRFRNTENLRLSYFKIILSENWKKLIPV